MNKPTNPATVDHSLRIAHGVKDNERDHVVSLFDKLNSRLRSFPADSVEMQLSIKERDEPSMQTTLEAWIARHEPIIATSHIPDVDAALIEVRDDMIRQITDMKTRQEPRNNRHLREATD